MPNRNQPRTLYEQFSQAGQRLPSVQERRQQFNLGPEYRGTAQQNTALLGRIQSGAVPMPPIRPSVLGTAVRPGVAATPNRPIFAQAGYQFPTISGQIGTNSAFVGGTPPELQLTISEAATKYGISPKVLSALLKQESGFNPRAISPVGARGIAQFMPATAKAYGINPEDVTSSIHGAANYLSDMLKRFGALDKALAAYNAGPGAVERYGGIPPYRETQNYVKSIYGMTGETNIPESVQRVLAM